jgi:hypothetical protein
VSAASTLKASFIRWLSGVLGADEYARPTHHPKKSSMRGTKMKSGQVKNTLATVFSSYNLI